MPARRLLIRRMQAHAAALPPPPRMLLWWLLRLVLLLVVLFAWTPAFPEQLRIGGAEGVVMTQQGAAVSAMLLLVATWLRL